MLLGLIHATGFHKETPDNFAVCYLLEQIRDSPIVAFLGSRKITLQQRALEF
jgi:hypothetical protein